LVYSLKPAVIQSGILWPTETMMSFILKIPELSHITSDLAGVVCQLSRMAITNDLPSVFRLPVQKFFGCWVSQMAITSRFATVFWWLSGMASGFISSPVSSFIRTGLLFALLLACSWAGYAADFLL